MNGQMDASQFGLMSSLRTGNMVVDIGICMVSSRQKERKLCSLELNT
jgi:hypothetical protein